ncbi:MAG: FAD-binding oxidoreductase [Candidatus Eremiobacteraeota bacterium]|nr:FAD-binding oxidoreductase [Candidatus Eremiobacteraeota bacterium]
MAVHRSLWLEECLPGQTDAPALHGRTRADVAIIGGGYVGLWTALRIKELEPACDVVILERDICGGGASGRNGGFILSWWPKYPSMAKAFGEDEALRLTKASQSAIGEIGAFCTDNRIDADFIQHGWLWTATSNVQMGAWEAVVSASERLGLDAFERLAPIEVARRSGSPAHRAGVLEHDAATVQPAALVRGMRDVALRRSVRIYETTPVRHFTRERPVLVTTTDGELTADRVVIAMNAWSVGLPELSRSIAVISSDIIATAPIPDRLAQIGWTGGESITDSQMMVCYYRTTRDGRIAFGKGGWGIVYGDRIGPSLDRDVERARLVERDFRSYYPMLADVSITHDWCGPIDRAMDGLPLIGALGGREHIHYGIGWSGNGVGPSYVGGRILASLALGRSDEWSQSPLVDRKQRLFPPEPIRFVGGQLVRNAVISKERAENADRRPPWLSVQLAKLAPAGLEDKE